MNHRTFFVDTNLFLQCLAFEQIPWADISGGNDILLLIGREVQEEIDRLKSDGNSRRSNRARKANSFIREILLCEGHKTIRGSNPKVEIGFSPDCRIHEDIVPGLDLSRPDNRIVAEAILFSKGNENTYFLSHDTNPLLTAKRMGLKWIAIPETWLLPPEPDSRDKKISDLEKQIKTYAQNFPSIQVTSKLTIGNQNGRILIRKFEPLSEADKEFFVQRISNFFPPKKEYPTPKKSPGESTFGSRVQAAVMGIPKYIPPSDSEIDKYLRELYPKWKHELSEYFSNIHYRFENYQRFVEVSFYLDNDGIVPAEDFEIRFNVMNGAEFTPVLGRDVSHRETESNPIPPPPPKYPSGKWTYEGGFGNQMMEASKVLQALNTGFGPSFDSHLLSGPKKERDRTKFYWKSPIASYNDEVELECKEYRHKTGVEPFNLEIFLPYNFDSKELCVTMYASARNMPDPIKSVFKVDVVTSMADTRSEIEVFIDREIRKVKFNTNFVEDTEKYTPQNE